MIPAAPLTGFAAPLDKPAHGEEIDRALQASVSAREIPGVVAMAAKEQSVVYEGAFGFRDIAAASRMSTDTVFRIASMVKLLTSVAALQLVERGTLKLDEPAGNIDPALASAQILTGFDAKGVPQLRPAQKPLTLRNLLTHTSGFSYPLWDPNVGRYLKRARKNPHLPRMPLMFEPGSRWAYGGSLDRVGRMVEIAGGQNLDRYFSDHITGPLGMNDTTFSLTEQQRAREASLHVRDGNWKASSAAAGKAEGSESVFRWRRHLFHRAGLSDPAAGAVEWWKFSRDKHPSAGDRCPDVHKPDRQR